MLADGSLHELGVGHPIHHLLFNRRCLERDGSAACETAAAQKRDVRIEHEETVSSTKHLRSPVDGRLRSSPETEGKHVRVVHDEPEPDDAAGQASQVGARFPADRVFDGVAHAAECVSKRKAVDRLSPLILHLDAHAPGRGRRIVDHEPVSAERQRPCEQLTADQGRPDGSEAVRPQ